MTAKQIKVLAAELGLERVDCRSNFYWVRDAEENLRLGYFYRGITARDFRQNVESTKIYGEIIEKAPCSVPSDEDLAYEGAPRGM